MKTGNVITIKFLIILFCICSIANGQENLKYCGADELRIQTLQQHPKIAKTVIHRDVALETFTYNYVKNNDSRKSRSVAYKIPVVFHVIHNYGTENISDEQILDGLTILNKTFRKQLADTGSIVAAFKPIHADCEIEFHLAKKDPNGNCTKGINRIASPLTSIGDHSVKTLIQWPTDQYLNVYIVDNAAGLAGHCVWPGDADTIPEWDGIVIGHDYVGSIGTSNYQRSVAFAHECGHYLNLHHIWGGNNVPGFYYLPCAQSSNCGSSDSVADTPPTIGWQSCNLTGASCGNVVDNVQNTMDYSYCNRMFTYGQKARMQACLNSPIAGRNNLWQSSNLLLTGIDTLPDQLCAADFIANKTVVCENPPNTIDFTNSSYNGSFTSLQWTFPGGTPSSSTSTNPIIAYNTPGTYPVTLKVFNGSDSMEITKNNFISVLPATGNPYPYFEDFETVSSLNGMDWFESSFDTINHWEITNAASVSGTKSVMLDNFNNSSSTKDELYSEIIDLTGATSLNISFKYAYAKKNATDNDRLQLYVTGNCNSTWIQRINLTGTVLETAAPTSSPFIPTALEWKQASSFLSSGFFTSGFRYKFVFSSNGGNNVYIDDINIDVDASIQNHENSPIEFQVFPNPTNENIYLNLSLKQDEILQISVQNIDGKTVFLSEVENFTKGNHQQSISTNNLENGLYFVAVSTSYGNLLQKIIVVK